MDPPPRRNAFGRRFVIPNTSLLQLVKLSRSGLLVGELYALIVTKYPQEQGFKLANLLTCDVVVDLKE